MTYTSDYLTEQAMEAGFDAHDMEVTLRQDIAAQVAAWTPADETLDTSADFVVCTREGDYITSTCSLQGAQQEVVDGTGAYVEHQCTASGTIISQGAERCPTCGAR